MQHIWPVDPSYNGQRPEEDGGAPLSEQVVALRRRVAELEQQLPDTHRSGAVLGRELPVAPEELFDALALKAAEQAALLDALPAMVFFKDRDHRYILVNKAYSDYHRIPVEQILGKRDEELFVPETARTYHDNDEAVMASGQPKLNVELRWKLADGSDGWSLENDVPYRDSSGRVAGMVGIVIDVTARKLAEEALRRAESDLRATRERLLDTISALSTPVLPIDDGILVLPIVGHIDATRSDQIMDALLDGVERHGAEVVIVDLTGVPVVDGAVTCHLLRAAHAVRLLGAQCILVGISPATARSLVQTGAGLDELILLRDLRAGVRHALARRQRGVLPRRSPGAVAARPGRTGRPPPL
ncbi:anti-anti sigma factor protein [Sorangium cellulosum]|uniref:Anti-anti sigma factor protein n=1 Tax=Sorangium cellulosum TaxID=56 RepID=A0A2L0EPM9_SORCE|nr:PAS domain-containing protein [Sorangium cellulosum]AUX41222.1 anti-anti sigma factor protein [Sorangium cellulosum]